jgi:osmotically inducible protein OsmC
MGRGNWERIAGQNEVERELAMPTRTADVVWNGGLTDGKGQIKLASGAFDGPYDWRSRSADGTSTNPEELLAAAHAGCFSMAFSHVLGQGGFPPKRIHTVAKVTLEQQGEGFVIPRIELETEAEVPKIDEATFQTMAKGAKDGCPVSKALAGVQISLKAKLLA